MRQCELTKHNAVILVLVALSLLPIRSESVNMVFICQQGDPLAHAKDHGVVFAADSSYYMDTANHFTLKGGPNAGTIVDASATKGCRDDWIGFGCKAGLKKQAY